MLGTVRPVSLLRSIMSSDAASPPWDYIAKLVCIGDSGCGKSSLTIRLCEGRFVAHHDVTIGVEFGSRIVPVGPPHSSSLARPDAASSSTLFPDQQQQKDDAQTGAATSPTSQDQQQQDQQQQATPAAATAAATAAASGGLPAPRRNPKAQDPPQPQKHMKLSLWDTAGQETYKSVTRSYFRGASGALLVFDLTRRQTFQHAIDWLNDLRQIAEPDIVVVLVGNKADLTMQKGADDAGGGGDGDTTASKKNQREVTRHEAEDWARRNGVLEYVETSAKSGENVEMAFMRVAERIYQNIQAGKYDLNDRRSGVKGPSAGGARQVKLSTDASKRAGYGGCC